MIAISFIREQGGSYIRELLLPSRAEPLREPVSLPELYPGKQFSWETSLEERPDLPELGQRLFAAALGETGQQVYHQRRTQGVQLRFRSSPTCPKLPPCPGKSSTTAGSRGPGRPHPHYSGNPGPADL